MSTEKQTEEYYNSKAAITHNEIIESIAITAVFVTMWLKRFSAVCDVCNDIN